VTKKTQQKLGSSQHSPENKSGEVADSMLLSLPSDVMEIILKHAITTFRSMRGLFLSCKRLNTLIQSEYISVRDIFI
jgi:hypothetical protein